MEKITINKIITVETFKAYDGRVFNTEADCLKHEATINKNTRRKEAFNVIKEMETAMVGDKIMNFASPGNEYVNCDSYSYPWYKPKNELELHALEDYFEISLDAACINSWINIESQYDIENFDEGNPSDDNYFGSLFSTSVESLETFFKALGYTMALCKIQED